MSRIAYRKNTAVYGGRVNVPCFLEVMSILMDNRKGRRDGEKEIEKQLDGILL